MPDEKMETHPSQHSTCSSASLPPTDAYVRRNHLGHLQIHCGTPVQPVKGSLAARGQLLETGMLRSEWSVGRGESPSFHQALLMVGPSSNHTNILGTQLGTSANLGDHTKSIATNHNYNCSQRHPLAQIGVNGSLEKCGRNHPIQVAGQKAITSATGHAKTVQPAHTPIHMTLVTMNVAIRGEDSVVRP